MTLYEFNKIDPAPRGGVAGAWCLCVLIFSLFYALTCQQGVSWQDSGTFQWRVLTGDYVGRLGLALAHPLYIFVARIFDQIPMGSSAWRLNVFSGIGMSVALANLAGVLTLLTGRRWIGLLIATMLAVAHAVWWLSTLAEVYTWSVAGLTAELWLLAVLYTHFATADEADQSYALAQLENFRGVVDVCGGDDLTIHAANSAACIDLPESHFDMIRPGIAVYGYQPSDQMHNILPLRPCLRLRSLLMQIKDLPAGSSVGYGLTHTFDRAARVGLVPVGYADGYPRGLSGKASMRIAGVDIPVCGRVAMDQVIVDLSEVPSVQIGDEVEVISSDPSTPHSVENLARLAGTIPYEITCGLGGRINRTAVE
jgi:hypothetical protein